MMRQGTRLSGGCRDDFQVRVSVPRGHAGGAYGPAHRQPAPEVAGEAEPQVRYVLNKPRVAGAAAVALCLLALVVPRGNALANSAEGAGAGDASPVASFLVPGQGGARGIEWVVPAAHEVDASKWDGLCYAQEDPRWGEELFQNGSIGATGCGLCSTAHALTILLDREITPDVLADQFRAYSDSVGGIDYGSQGVVWDGWEEVLLGTYGDRIDIGRTECSADAVREALQEGRMVLVNPPEGSVLKQTDGTMGILAGGHVVMVYKYEDGQFWEKDSYQPGAGAEAGQIRYTADELEEVLAGCQSHLGYLYTIGLRG